MKQQAVLQQLRAAICLLQSPEGVELRRSLPALVQPRVLVAWRNQYGDPLAGWLARLCELTPKARAKLGPWSESWLFTRRSLEQASSWRIAKYKASRLPAQSRVIDLCCGLGVDLAAFAAVGWAMGIERDPELCLIAAANASCVAPQRVATICADARRCSQSANRWIHADPDRRHMGKRATAGERLEPGLGCLWQIQSQAAGAVIKLAPATVVDPEYAKQAELEWISESHECKQQLIWRGEPFACKARRATRICSDGESVSFVGSPQTACSTVTDPLDWLIDFDPAIRAAGLSESFAEAHGLLAVGGPHGFFTTDCAGSASESLLHGLARRFKVESVVRLDRRTIRHELRAQRVRVTAVHPRAVRGGWPTDPRLWNDQSTTSDSTRHRVLLLSQAGQSGFAAICSSAESNLDH